MQTSKHFITCSNIKSVQLKPCEEYAVKTDDLIIYTIYLPNFLELKPDLREFLNSKELNKAERFHKELDRNRFIICRSILKIVLAAHTKLEAKNICLDYHFNKKPYLASHPGLYFNISHSGDFAVIAVSRNNVGIDIEYISEELNFTNLLPAIFEENEILTIQNTANKKHAFYTLWTRKEAFVKALGKGIDEDFKYIPCLDGQHIIDSTLLKTTKNWRVFSFELADHYLGAIAFESFSTVSKNPVSYTMPNTMKELLEMSQIRND